MPLSTTVGDRRHYDNRIQSRIQTAFLLIKLYLEKELQERNRHPPDHYQEHLEKELGGIVSHVQEELVGMGLVLEKGTFEHIYCQCEAMVEQELITNWLPC